MDILTIGIIAAIAYFALQDGSEAGIREQPSGYNPDIRVSLKYVNEKKDKVEVALIFAFPESITPDGKEFKNNRVAGSLFYRGEKIAEFRDPFNFTLKNDGKQKGTVDIIDFPKNYTGILKDFSFWQEVRAVGDFESRDKRKIFFDNPIDFSSFKTTEPKLSWSDIYKTFFG